MQPQKEESSKPVVLDNYKINYKGDLRGKIEGQILGPNRMGEFFTIKTTEYDSAKDITTARVNFTTQEDLQNG